MNFTVGNVVKRIYHIIREECTTLKLSIKDHLALPFKGGKYIWTNLYLRFIVAKDTIRLDSLKSMNLQKKAISGILSKDDDLSLEKIDEDA